MLVRGVGAKTAARSARIMIPDVVSTRTTTSATRSDRAVLDQRGLPKSPTQCGPEPSVKSLLTVAFGGQNQLVFQNITLENPVHCGFARRTSKISNRTAPQQNPDNHASRSAADECPTIS